MTDKEITSWLTSSREGLISGYVKNGYTLTPLNGKVPLVKDWVKTEYNPSLTADDIKGNYGVVLQNDDLIVDVDPRNFKNKENSLKQLITDLGLGVSEFETFTVKTGGGGLHLYFKKPADFNIRGGLKKYPGVEFKSKGLQVVGAGSVHPETKKAYSISKHPFKPQQAPQALLGLIERPEIHLVSADEVRAFTDTEQNINRYIKFLQSCPPAIQGEGGDVLTFKTACRGRDFALSSDKTFQLMAEHFNPRCMPIWDIEELKKKVENAYSYNIDVVGKNTAESDFEKVLALDEEVKGKQEEDLKWDVTANGQLRPTIRNVVNYLLCKEYPLLGMLRNNIFTDHIEYVKPSPWHNGRELGGLRNSDSAELMYWLSANRGFNVSESMCTSALEVVANMFPYHPVRDYLKSLKWDGVERLDKWLTTYAGVDDNELTNAIGKSTLIGAVARIFKPGCKFDTMLILEGEQGIGKSTLVSILGGAWYREMLIIDNDKTNVENMLGGWIIEVSEMVCSRKVEADRLKAFLSRNTDHIRLAYERHAGYYPRQSIFIGTINPEEVGYLRDTTGNRRFWPVYCNEINLTALKRDRDQLWAEACVRYNAGEDFHLNTKELRDMLKEETEDRMEQDPWADLITAWLFRKNNEHKKEDFYIITNIEILEECIGILASRVTRLETVRVSRVMKKLGYKRGKFYDRRTKKRIWSYRIDLNNGETTENIIDLKELGLDD